MNRAGSFGDRLFFYCSFLVNFVLVLYRNSMMKKFAFLFTALFCTFVSLNLSAMRDPDAPGSKVITVQAGGFPGYGGLVSGNVAITRLGSAAHLYGGLQAGANFRIGHATDAKKLDLSVAPRFVLGFNFSQVVEFHAGAFAGVAAQRFNDRKMDLQFSYGGFGGFRFNISPSVGLLLEGCYSPCLPYTLAGLAFRF